MFLQRTQPAVYRLLAPLGRGGAGHVFRAERLDPHYGVSQELAVKLMNSKDLIEEWKVQFKALCQVQSQYCVRIHGWEVFKNGPGLTMELIDGVTLSELCKFTTLSATAASEILRQVRLGLIDLNQVGLCHGDLSPNNIMIDTSGNVKLIDFGAYLAYPSGKHPRTDGYFDPNHCSEDPVTATSDAFAFRQVAKFLGLDCDFFKSSYWESITNISGPAKLEAGEQVRWIKSILNVAPTQRQEITGALKSAYWRIPQLSPILVVLVLALSATPSARTYQLQGGFLSVRTLKWYRVKINGQDMGYTPLRSRPVGSVVDIELVGGSGKKWQRQLKIKPGQAIVISDSNIDSNTAPM